jgi:acyl-CoA synthetase (AMP-forming)/AMP-acid ligase II
MRRDGGALGAAAVNCGVRVVAVVHRGPGDACGHGSKCRHFCSPYVVARPLAATVGLDASIVDYLRSRVPAHLIPTRIRVVADLVYTASGKVDRHRIKEAMA